MLGLVQVSEETLEKIFSLHVSLYTKRGHVSVGQDGGHLPANRRRVLRMEPTLSAP